MIDQAAIARPPTGYSSGRHRRPASRRARPSRLLLACACVTAAAAAAAGCSMLGPMMLPLALLLVTTLNLATSSLEAQWRAYAWRSPEAAAQLAWPSPITAGDEQMRFSLIVCALNEADVIGDTLRSLIRQTHQQYQIIVSLRASDLATIEAVRAFERHHPGAIEVVIGHYAEHGKAAQLNGALPYCTGDAVSPIDAEGDVAPELLVHVEALFRQTGADVVQGAVQLMNLGHRIGQWFQAHSVLEYQAWYSSRMLFQVQAGFVPLGGNTVFIRTELIRRAGGWPCTPTEDCAIGVLLCSQYGARVVAAYGPDLATREEVPATVFNKDKGSIFWQRVRWLDGIFQELVRGSWLRMPTLRKKILAGYILAAPILQSVSCALLPVALITAVALKVPESLALYTFVPVIPIAFTMMAMLSGLRQFGRDFGQQIRVRHYASILFLTPLYQTVLAAAAAVAIYKYLSGDKSWYRTGRSMEHRGLAPAAPQAEELAA
jgi:cellulose synthase/poly-beta-1,6-N-acetylglucosamine synthase-like glycosyltransferase